MKHFSHDPFLVAEKVSSPRATASALLIEGAALFGLLVLASMVAVAPVALRLLSGN